MRRTLLASAILVAGAAAVVFSAQTENQVHFHHVHLNAANVPQSIEFYRDIFGGVPVRFAGGRMPSSSSDRFCSSIA